MTVWLLSSISASLIGTTVVVAPGLTTDASAAAPEWGEQQAPAGVFQYASVSCAARSICEAVGSRYGAVISDTTDAGSVWLNQDPSPDLQLPEANLTAIACASISTCVAVGQVSTSTPLILATEDGGATWFRQPASASSGLLAGVSCPSSLICVAVGEDHLGKGVILATSNGGASWSRQTVPPGIGLLHAVSCPSVSQCIAVGFGGSAPDYSGTVLRTISGGTTWSRVRTSSPGLTGVSCPSTSRCVAVGDTPGHPGAILTSGNGGSSWHSGSFPQPSSDLYSVACGRPKSCVVVGVQGTYPNFHGLIDHTTNSGASWTRDVTPKIVSSLQSVTCVESACVAVGEAGNPATRSIGVILRHT